MGLGASRMPSSVVVHEPPVSASIAVTASPTEWIGPAGTSAARSRSSSSDRSRASDCRRQARHERVAVREPPRIRRPRRLGREREDLEEARELRIVADRHHQGTVACLERLVRDDVRVGVAGPRRLDTGGEVVAEDVDERGHAGLDEPDLDRADPPATDERGQRAERALEPGDEVEERDAHLRRRPVRLTGDRHQAAHRLREEVVGGPIRVGTAEPADAGDDQPRVRGAQRICAEAEPRGRGGAVVVDEQIGIGEQPSEGIAPRIGPQVEHDAALVAVDGREVGAAPILRVSPPRWTPGARLVALRRLDLHDVRAEIGEEHRRERPGQHAAEVDDADAVEGERIGHAGSVPAWLARLPLHWTA